MAKLMLAVGLWVDYSYVCEIFTSFYSMDNYEVAMELNRFIGAYAWVFWGTMVFNVLQIQLLWFERVRRNPVALFLISLGVLFGMWLERLMFIVSSLYRDYVPSVVGHVLSHVLGHRVSGRVGRPVSALYLVFVRGWGRSLSMFELRELVVQRNRADARDETP